MTQSNPSQNASVDKPNIIVILVDDMGFSDIGCFGSEIHTPNLDRLAAGGMVFSQMYNCARCCPTRASLLTGLYQHQAGVGLMVANHGEPGYLGYLRDDCVTIAEALSAGGYRTFMSGKWHCGGSYKPETPELWRPGSKGFPYPMSRGFEKFFGTVAGGGSYFQPYALMEQDRFIDPGDPEFYYTDAISDKAVNMIDKWDSSGRDGPFFLHVAYTAPHWPLHAQPEDIARYEGKYRSGWDAVRTARHETLKSMGLVDEKWDISPRDTEAPEFNSLDAKRRDWEDMRMAVYAAQVDRMDQGVGQILSKLDELNLSDNTMVMFLSDNGGCAEFLAEDGHIQSYDQVPPGVGPMQNGNRPDLRPGPADTFMSYDLPWANASNTPFRLYKHWVHEGGISTPLLVRWPKAIQPGGVTHSPCHVIDIMATCLDVAGLPYPESYDNKPIQPLEGQSLTPLLKGQKFDRRSPIFFEHEGNRAVRLDNWKLVSKHPSRWELYNMNEDRTELNDLAAKDQTRVREMETMYEQWAERCGVLERQQVLKLPIR